MKHSILTEQKRKNKKGKINLNQDDPTKNGRGLHSFRLQEPLVNPLYLYPADGVLAGTVLYPVARSARYLYVSSSTK